MAYAWNSFNTRMAVGLLPSNATPAERAFDLVVADRFARLPVEAVRLSRSAQDAPADWLPYLAAERSVDEFSSAWQLDQRRAVVADSFAYHQKKGTRAALDRALGQMSLGVRVIEWFEVSPARTPYTFRLVVQLQPSSVWRDEFRRQAVRLVNAAKNAHTLLQQIDIGTRQNVGIHVGMAFASRVRTRMAVPPVVPPPPEPLAGAVAIRFGMGLMSRITHRMRTA